MNSKKPKINLLSTLQSLELFKSFPEEILLEIEEISSLVSYTKNETVLTQGQTNHDIFILLSGNLKVEVDGSKLTELSGSGDIIGEMSLISIKPVSATIKALGFCELLKINGKLLMEKSDQGNFRTLYFIHKLFSLILSEKLKTTNQKAKHYETLIQELELYRQEVEKANEELENKVIERTKELEIRSNELLKINSKLEQQKTALIVSKKQIEELYSARDFTFKKLDSLYLNYLIPLSESLATMEELDRSTPCYQSVSDVRREVSKAIEFIKPISQYYRIEKSMVEQKVLLIDSHKKQQVIAKMALGGTGVVLDIADDVNIAKEKFLKQSHGIVFIASDQIDFVNFAHNINKNTLFVLMTSSPVQSYIDQVLNCKVFPNIVSRSTKSRSFSAKNIVTTITKLAGKNIFGLDRYITWGAEVREHKVTHSNARKNLIDSMNHYFRNLGVRKSICSRCELVAEELLMNAIYDAPVDENGKTIYNHLDRTIDIKLKEEEQGKIRYATDGNVVAVSVEDPFGALEGETVLKYLKSCYEGRAGVYNFNKGGAGRGLHQIVEHSDLIIFNVSKGVRTEVIALFFLDNKSEEENYPSFHYFSQ